ncbi:MAG TPA: sugar phosphate isomerase/epimerase [Isosphaeraceae bacterium]
MPRIVSCFTNCFGPSGVRAAVERVKVAGIDHLELALRGHNFGGLVIPESAVVTEKATDEEAGAFVALLHRHDVKVSGCNVGGADIRTEDGVELTEGRIAFAKRWFDVGVVVSGAGQPANPDERRIIVEHLRRIGRMAGDLGIVVALETHKGPTQNAAAMLDLMNDVDHPGIRLNFDTGNIAYYNEGVDPADELEKVAPLVRNVHVKDNRGRFEDWYFPAVGDGGAVDFRRVWEILDGVGYTGAYTIEIEGIAGEPEPGLDGRVERVRRSVDHLRKCGYFE